MKKLCNTFWFFLQVTAFILFSAYAACAGNWLGLSPEHTDWISLTLKPPTESVLSIQGHKRHYTVQGNALLMYHSFHEDAQPNIYFTYQSSCVFDPQTMEARESTSFQDGTGKNYTLTTRMKCLSDPGINQHATCTILSITGTLLKKIPSDSIKSNLPFYGKVLSAGQKQSFMNQVIEQAKSLEVMRPEKNHAYPADHEVLVSVRQDMPSDIAGTALEWGTQAMVRLVNIDDPKNHMAKLIPLMATGLGLKSFSLPKGHWKVQAFVYSPYVGNAASAKWNEFWVGSKPPVYTMLHPTPNQLITGDLDVEIRFKEGESEDDNCWGTLLFYIYWFPPPQSGQGPPDRVYSTAPSYNVGNYKTYKITIPKNLFFNKHKDGRYSLYVKIYPKGNGSQEDYILKKCTFYAGDMANLINNPSHYHATKTMSLKHGYKGISGIRLQPFKAIYHAPARVSLQARHPAGEKILYQFQYKSFADRVFKAATLPTHTKTLGPGKTAWTFNLRKPGFWRVRVRTKAGRNWGKWHEFKVTSQKKAGKKRPVSAINPKKKIHFSAPVIVLPKQGQRFSIHARVPFKITFSGTSPLTFQFEHKSLTNSARYKQEKVSSRGLKISKGVATSSISFSKTGTWRLRVKGTGEGGQWSPWRSFSVRSLSNKHKKIFPKPVKTIKPKLK